MKPLFRATAGAGSRSGVALVLSALMCMAFVPVVGLAVDGAVVYMMRAKMSGAIDAAVLAGARSLNVGTNVSAQAANATAIAQKYFDANLPAGVWGSSNISRTVSVGQNDTTKMRWVTVTASADVPLTFLSVLAYKTAHIGLTGQAQRRDVNVVLVLDHSGSMKNAMPAMQSAATTFVNYFASGRDNIGLVSFIGSYYNAYNLSKNFQTDSPNVDTLINSLVSDNGGTGTAQALWEAYGQLQTLNQPGALNVIVLFTDGLANTFTADFKHLLSSGSTCKDQAPKIGAIGAGDPSGVWGLTAPVSASLTDADDNRDVSNSTGCIWTNGNVWAVSQGLTGIPSTDNYGNSTNGTGTMPPYAPVSLSPVTNTDVANAGANALDDAASRIRRDTNLSPVIYCIGLGGNPGSPPDQVLMARVANDPSSAVYNTKQAAGLFIFSPSTAQLQSAFQRIASQILRLSQ